MKLNKILALLLLLCLLLPSCASTLTDEPEKPEGTVTKEETNQEETTTEEKSTEDNQSEEKKTEEKKEPVKKPIMQTANPADDNEFNLLMIGNSFCYYYVEELYNLLEEAGINAKVCNVYYSGCTIKQHWNWFLDNANPYQYFTTDKTGRKGVRNMSLKECLEQENWDVITLQSAGGTFGVDHKDTEKVNSVINSSKPAAKKLYDYVKSQFPQSEFYWQETWTYEVGYDRSNGKMENAEQQENYRQVIRAVSRAIAEDNAVKIIPTGEAWHLARKNPIVGDTLCIRKGVNSDQGDHYHDGDLGGGQYLNACVWFEVLTGKSCVGSTWRPDYDLKEEKIPVLQNAAHKAVAEMYGADFAK